MNKSGLKLFASLLSAFAALLLSWHGTPAQEALNSKTSTNPTLYQCIDMPLDVYNSLPPPLLNPSTYTESETLQALCPFGQVPQPVDRFGPKGRLVPPYGQSFDIGQLTQPSSGVYFFYNSGYQYYYTTGADAKFTQNSPHLTTSDSHTLAEIAVESADSKQIVEVGWTVDRAVNGGSTIPHLFTFHWVNGKQTCYNGCGYVQISKTRHPGMSVSVTNTPQEYTIQYRSGNWWIGYQGEWIGYFPGSLWGGHFTKAGLTQWFGEVAASSAKPCTDMGNGLFGTNPNAATISNIHFINGPYASPYFIMTNPTHYKIGGILGPRFRYGGPGAC